jgi:3-hydroxyisobutyrate dehydrogenase-like beta-hydroxyacid dehydrogenase
MPEPGGGSGGSRVGVIGLGAMGAPIARRLAAAGHPLLVHDVSPAAAASVPGAAVAATAAEVVEGVDLLLTCLPSPEAVEAVYAGVARPRLVAGDLSTVDPELARGCTSASPRAGVAFAECPMLGGVAQAEAGELLLVLSGPEEACRRLEPLFGAIARAWRHVGGPGTASLFKTVQNGLGLAQLVAIAEALTLVERAGADPAAFVEVVDAGRGMAASPLFAARAPMMLDPTPPRTGPCASPPRTPALAAATARRLGLGRSAARPRPRPCSPPPSPPASGERDISAVVRVVRERDDRGA